jgi:hypothetical protein
MKPSPSPEHDEQDQEIIKLLKDLGSFKSTYPSELLAARRAAFLAQVEELGTAGTDEALPAEDQGIVKLLGELRSAQADYPPHLLAARRSALLRQLEGAETSSIWDQLFLSIQRTFQGKTPSPGVVRLSFVIGSLIAVVVAGSLFFARPEGSFQPLPLGAAGDPTHSLPVTGEVTITICKPDDQTLTCAPAELDPSQDLANQGNGLARPAVAKDARPSQDGAHMAAYVNDGRGGASWVSNSPDSWIKIDLGTVRMINTVSLRKGSLGPSNEDDPGQFVIAVALSDVYADGDSSYDYVEYAQVFDSEQAGFSGRVSPVETIQTRFSPVEARFVKITFEKAGAAIEELDVFMVEPPEVAEQPTSTPGAIQTEMTVTPTGTSTLLAIATQTATPVPIGTHLPTETAAAAATNTLSPTASNTPVILPTNTLPPADPATPVPTRAAPSNTPRPSPTAAPPTEIPPTAVPPTVQPPPSTEPIVVTGSDQTVTFTCNGNAVEIRGHANTVTLLGSCSSITVSGNGNRVFWESGSPVITIKGNDNIVQQL